MRPHLHRLLPLASLALISCGGGVLDVHATRVDDGLSRYSAGLTVGQAGGCSTSIVQGLTDQLVAELNCLAPNQMVNFAGAHTNLYSAVQPFLAPGASTALLQATQAKNDVITISSAYRSLPQQYLLYKWWKAGQCGIQAAAVPGSSNHQSGRALDIPSYSYWRASLESKGWKWFGSNDTVHFDYLAAPNVASNSIKAFQILWNKNKSSKLAEDGQWGPATESAMAASPTAGFAVYGCTSSGVVKGAIYQAGELANRVSGATVSVGQTSVVTKSDGMYELTLPPGTHTVKVAKSGYTSNQVTRTVTAGATAWGSMEVNPVATTGTLQGTVKAAGGAALSGALVTVGGQTRTTGAAGGFEVTLPAGSHALSASRDGYGPVSLTVQITAGMQTPVTVTLAPTTVDLPPQLALHSPADAASHEVALVTLTGSAVDDGGPLASVQVSVNGGEWVAWPVEAGTFAVQVKLRPGDNQVTLEATDGAGATAGATWTGTFRSGLTGIVRRYDEKTAWLGGVQVTLLDAATAAPVGTALSDAAGRFELDVAQVPGEFALTLEADGYQRHTQTLLLSDEARGEVEVGLTPGETGVFAIRFIEPRAGVMLEDAETNVSGVVSGLQVQGVTVNGEEALLFGESAFLGKVALREGPNLIEVVAQSPEGHTVTATLQVDRAMRTPVTGGCATGGGTGPAGAAMLLLGGFLLLRRRRQER